MFAGAHRFCVVVHNILIIIIMTRGPRILIGQKEPKHYAIFYDLKIQQAL